MNRRVQRGVGRALRPVIIAGLKLHTAITGQERARGIVTNERGELLLVRDFIGSAWTLPGGGIERGETPLRAVVREVYEETGISVDASAVRALGVLDAHDAPLGYTAHIFGIVVMAEALPAAQFNTREIIEVGWFSGDQLPPRVSPIVLATLALLSKR